MGLIVGVTILVFIAAFVRAVVHENEDKCWEKNSYPFRAYLVAWLLIIGLPVLALFLIFS